MKLIEFDLPPHPQTFKRARILMPVSAIKCLVTNIDADGKPEGTVVVDGIPVVGTWEENVKKLQDA